MNNNMPRIPVRVEPYNSPSRQHRHYKNKRDQVLRALGKAAYINGSHFAIMWVSARGDVETYASEALQTRLDDWFVKGGIADEAKQLVKSCGGSTRSGAKVFEDSDEEVGGEEDAERGEDEEDVFLDGAIKGSDLVKKGKRGPLAPLDTNIANQHFLRSRGSFNEPPKSAPLFPTSSLSTAFDDAPRTSTPILSSSSRLMSRNSLSSSSSSSNTVPTPTLPSLAPTYEITLSNHSSRTAFLELRFGQLQQGVCKTVAKAWIKIIEPKKQTRCPYNKGEAGKPDWWPAGVRHKEPDHLMKPERHLLLLTILRSPRVKVARLQLATAEVVALIKADKVSLLMDVYRIAREEEKLRERGVEGEEEEVRVGVSTLDGWCKEGSEMTIQGRQIARSATPEATSSSTHTTQAAPGEKRKRTAAVGSTSMIKSHSTGGGAANVQRKRRSIATSSLSAEVRPTPLPARAAPANAVFGEVYDPMQHQLVGLGLVAPGLPANGTMGMPRSHSFSAATASNPANPGFPQRHLESASADTSPWPPAYAFPSASSSTEINGLATPLTSTSTVDPSYPQHHHPQDLFYHNFPSYPPPPPPHHNPTDLPPNPADMSAINAINFPTNALGLEHWSFANFDLPEVLHSQNWQQSGAGGEESFSFDTSMASSAAQMPRTPSPGPPGGGGLRLDLGGKRGEGGAEEGLQNGLVAGGHAGQYWLAAAGGQHQQQS
ncbi:hypothetical protein PHBOTO_003934 [Pseudozyma hubeiensis]|nr:hypothetical protein PHBOTO_003934 [Pseudozyma hubeiensis]